MDKNTVIFVVEKDDQRFSIINQNLNRLGESNRIIRFKNGTDLLSFLNEFAQNRRDEQINKYILLFDSNGDKPDSVNILKTIKHDQRFKKIPVIIFTRSDSQNDIDNYYSIGCAMYFALNNGQKSFTKVMQDAGVFLSYVMIPQFSYQQNKIGDK